MPGFRKFDFVSRQWIMLKTSYLESIVIHGVCDKIILQSSVKGLGV